MPGLYLLALLISIGGLLIIDFKYKLAFSIYPIRTCLSIFFILPIFIFWDAWGITTEIFYKGHNNLLSGIELAKEFPVEEIFFLFLLCYQSLIFYNSLSKIINKRNKKLSIEGK